jgi:hypothetical protein
MVAGLYADKGGTPGNLLVQGQLTHPVSGWNTVAVPATNVSGGSVYWIAVLGPAGSGTLAFRDSGSNAIRSEESSQTTLTTLPATWKREKFGRAHRSPPMPRLQPHPNLSYPSRHPA